MLRINEGVKTVKLTDSKVAIKKTERMLTLGSSGGTWKEHRFN